MCEPAMSVAFCFAIVEIAVAAFWSLDLVALAELDVHG